MYVQQDHSRLLPSIVLLRELSKMTVSVSIVPTNVNVIER